MFTAPRPDRLDPLHEFLRACARVTLDGEDRARIVEAAAQVRNWSAAAACADQHGLTPLVWHHARASGVDTSTTEWRQIGALVLRLRDLGRAQSEALGEIVGAMEAAGIDLVVLKGAILAHLVYPRPDLRPMSDLDILVAPGDASRAQRILTELGFDVPRVPTRRVDRFHHHLPAATRRRGGAVVSVEIHKDALSTDQPVSLRLASLSNPPREYIVAGRRLRALGHVDMLLHLSLHVLEPREHTRLINVADLVGYAARYVAEIDWEFMRRLHPRVVNTLALMHYLTPLPEPLRALRPPEAMSRPTGIGRGFIPLGSVTRRGRGARGLVQHLLYPPDWWMRVYYGVPPHRSLFAVRWGPHLWRIAYWIGRRLVASSLPRGLTASVTGVD